LFSSASPTFEDDPRRQQRIQFTFLAGLAGLGLGDRTGARSAFAEVLALDASHLLALEEMKRL